MSASHSNQDPRRVLSLFMLAMMNTALVVGLEGFPTMAGFGLALVTWYLFFGLVYFIPVGFVAAELGVGFPREGGVYAWVKEALGIRWAFVASWMQWIQIVVWYPSVLAVCALAAADVFAPDLGDKKLYTVPAVIGIFWGSTLLNLFGIKLSGLITSLCLWVGTFIPTLLAILFAAWWLYDGQPSQMSFEPETFIPDLSSWGKVAIAMTLFSFLSGLEVNGVHFRRVKHPNRTIPLSLFVSMILVLGVSILGALSVAILVPREHESMAAGPLEVFHHFLSFYGLTGWIPLLGFCVLLGMVGHMIVWIIGPVETLRYAAEDGVIPPAFQKVNRAKVPRNLLLLQAAIVTLLCLLYAFVDMNSVFYIATVLSAQLYLVMYVLMFVSAIVLRYTRPNVERPFKIPGGLPGMWLVAGTGAFVGTAGIFILFTPPDDANMPMDPVWFVCLTITFFIVALLVPFVVYALRKPDWKSEEFEDVSHTPPIDS
ncbi:MAG: APC family permease [Phycisphaerales bacterium]|nr:APC family permease [Phycisphaerales bacterium]